jgi:hypothetical protein
MLPARLTITLLIGLALYFFIILMLLKNKKISLKYTLLWLLSGLLLVIPVVFPSILSSISTLFGFQSRMNGLVVMLIAFVIIIVMSITSIVSNQSRKIRNLVQYSAMLEKRIRELELNSGNNKE